MHWSLDQVRDLTITEYEQLVAWLTEQADRAKHGDSIDLDEIADAERAAAARKAIRGER